MPLSPQLNILMTPTMLKEYLPNILSITLVFTNFIAGKFYDVAISVYVLKEVEILTSNIILIFAAITIGLLVPQYWLVFITAIVILVGMYLGPDLAWYLGTSNIVVMAAVIVIMGFSSIANFSRYYRSK